MSDLISRQDMIATVYDQSDDDGLWAITAKEMEQIINEIPSAEPEIIRCKDCIYWWKEHELCKRNKDTRRNCAFMACKAEFFCANAKRRINE